MKNKILKFIVGTGAATAIAIASSTSAFAAEDAKEGGKQGAGKKGGGGDKADAIFAAIDTDNDGQITIKELAASKKFEGADRKAVGAAFASKDLNGDKSISEHEFTKTFGDRQDDGKGRDGKGRDGKAGNKGGKGKGAKGKG